MGSNNIIFVGGIHGVGKTTLCNYLTDELNIKNFSSSKLISELNSQRVNLDKTVDDIQGNQDVLLSAVDLFLDKDKNYILDGHFCLLDKNNGINKVPIETFKGLGLKSVIVLIDDPKNIASRINNRDSRDLNIEFIREFQEKEIEYAKYICEQLDIVCKILSPDDKDKLIGFIKNTI